MFKKIILLCLVFSTFLFIGCKETEKNDIEPITYDIELDVSESIKFSQEEINNAIEGLKNNFNLHCPDGTLLKIKYDDKSSDFYVNDHIRLLPNKKLKTENVISFLLDFDTGNSENTLFPSWTELISYPCILSQDKKGKWIIEVL